MQEILRAPELSATSRIVRIWIMARSPYSGLSRQDGVVVGQDGFRHDLLDPPPLVLGQRARLDDANRIALGRALLVVGHEGLRALDGLAIDVVTDQSLDRHHHGLFHLGRYHDADLLVPSPRGALLLLCL